MGQGARGKDKVKVKGKVKGKGKGMPDLGLPLAGPWRVVLGLSGRRHAVRQARTMKGAHAGVTTASGLVTGQALEPQAGPATSRR